MLRMCSLIRMNSLVTWCYRRERWRRFRRCHQYHLEHYDFAGASAGSLRCFVVLFLFLWQKVKSQLARRSKNKCQLSQIFSDSVCVCVCVCFVCLSVCLSVSLCVVCVCVCMGCCRVFPATVSECSIFNWRVTFSIGYPAHASTLRHAAPNCCQRLSVHMSLVSAVSTLATH